MPYLAVPNSHNDGSYHPKNAIKRIGRSAKKKEDDMKESERKRGQRRREESKSATYNF